MTKIIGRQNSIGIGKESTRGTAVTPTYWVPFLEVKADNKVESVVDQASLARLEDSDGMAVTAKYAEVSWKTKLKHTHFGLLMYSLFGTVSSVAKASPNTAVYDHTFSVAQSTSHQSLSVALKGSNDDVVFANAVVDSLSITAELGNYVNYEVSLIAKASASASNTVAHSAEKDYTPQMLTFKTATTQAGLTAASAVKIRNVKLEIKQNLLREHVLGAVGVNDVLNQSFGITGSIVLLHTDATYADMQNNETYTAMRFDFIHSDTIGTSSNPELQIDLHRARITNYERKMTINDMIEESFDFTAHYSLTDSKMITAILTNTATAY